MSIRVVALDLERTLISDAYNREPRPGLYAFLCFCVENFERVALFTAVNKAMAYEVLHELSRQGSVPQAFLDAVEYIVWDGSYKDLNFVPRARFDEVVLIDDDEGWIKPEQKSQWIGISEYDPYLVRGDDQELARVRQLLEEKMARRN
jgi:hypothetical protein